MDDTTTVRYAPAASANVSAATALLRRRYPTIAHLRRRARWPILHFAFEYLRHPGVLRFAAGRRLAKASEAAE